jgi:hypothetical protein
VSHLVADNSVKFQMSILVSMPDANNFEVSSDYIGFDHNLPDCPTAPSARSCGAVFRPAEYIKPIGLSHYAQGVIDTALFHW